LRALVTTADKSVELAEVDPPVPSANQALVAVRATSLNRGDLHSLANATPGRVVGLDLVGTVAEAAADGSGPGVGERVMGFTLGGAWAELAAVGTSTLSAIPDGLSDAQGAPLPNCGLTALCALGLAPRLLGARVLVTGATGGVGRYAVQLARIGGASVTGVVTSPQRAEELAGFDWLDVVVGDVAEGPFDLVVDGVAGASLHHALEVVGADGVVVTLGQAEAEPATIPTWWFARHMGARLVSMYNMHELDRSGRGPRDLALLAELVVAGRLDSGVSAEVSWADAPAQIDALRRREITGKVVMHYTE
jgi:NADPH:quinone reductase-like Zn-dependent oxidoreductase